MVVRTEWRISGRWLVKDQTEHICAGARRVCEHFEKRPRSVLTIRDEAQKLLLGALTAYIAWELWTFFFVVIRALARRRAGFSHRHAGNQVAQSIRASGKESTPLEALHANAAHMQGMLSASVAILELAGGGGTFDTDGNLEITEDHVQAPCLQGHWL